MNTESPIAEGAVALISGAGSGIGRATARALAALGCRVLLAGRRSGPLEAVAADIGESARACVLDITDADAVAGLIDGLDEEWRAIDILINNAGHDTGGRRRFDAGTADDWAAIVETNVIGLMRLTHAVVPGMLHRGRGDIVNMGSVAGIRPYATGTAYVASKHAVHGFSESLRRDYAGKGIRVIEIMPGIVVTDFAEARWDDKKKAESFYDNFDTVLEPEDIARTVAFAVSQPAHMVVSQLVVVPSSQK